MINLDIDIFWNCTFSTSILYYLTERRRSEEELREMDSKNKITEDMVS